MYLFYSGLRMVSPKTVSPSRFGWGKMIIGALILYLQVGLDYHLVPEGPLPIRKPSNATEAASVLVIDLIGVYIIFRGIWEGYSRRELQRDTPESPS